MTSPSSSRQIHLVPEPRVRRPFPRALVAVFRDQARRERRLIDSAAVPSARPAVLYLCVHDELRRRRAQAYLRLLDDHEEEAVALAAEILVTRRRAVAAAGVVA